MNDRTSLLLSGGASGAFVVALSSEQAASAADGAGRIIDGLNLDDGGGSTPLTLGGELANRPPDETGECPIGDAILITGGGLTKTGGVLSGLPIPVPSGHPAGQEVASAASAQHRALPSFPTAQVPTIPIPDLR